MDRTREGALTLQQGVREIRSYDFGPFRYQVTVLGNGMRSWSAGVTVMGISLHVTIML